MNVEVVHDGVIHFKFRHSLINIRYLKSGILPRFMYITKPARFLKTYSIDLTVHLRIIPEGNVCL
jgi:hypothetical protein